MENIYYLDQNNVIQHFGVKGMKWGVRRYQNEDGSLTNLGKSRQKMLDSKTRYNDALKKDLYNPTNKTARLVAKYSKEYDDAKLMFKTDKEIDRIRQNNVQFKNKSKHRLKLEESYRQNGLTQEQAQAAANNRIRTEKILAGMAGVTVAACAAYYINKNRKDKIDQVIKVGETLQRIEMRDTNGKLNDVFYAAKGSHDEKRYAGLLGMQRKQQTGHAYMMKLINQHHDVKVASKDKAAKVFGDLYKNDPDFRKAVAGNVKVHFNGSSNRVKDINNLSDRNIKKMYENFNAGLINIRNSGSGADKKYYDKLKSLGYGAIQDVNDMKYSGYNAKNPLIIFDNSGSNIMAAKVSEMTGNLNKNGNMELAKAMGEQKAKQFIEQNGPLAAAGLSIATVSVYNQDPTKTNSQKK